MTELVELYKQKFGADALPNLFGLPVEKVVSLLSWALSANKPLTPERMIEMGHPPAPADILL